MSTFWYISTDSANWVTLASAGIVNAQLTLRTNGPDDLSFDLLGDFLAADDYASGATIYLATGANTSALTCRFVGRVTTLPRQAMRTDERRTYRASGGLWWLDQITYQTQWQYLNGSNQLYNATVPRCILGQSDTGAARTMGAEITASLAWAIARGAPLQTGTVDDLATCPYSEHLNISCLEVIRQAIRLQPDVVCYCDYNTKSNGIYVPTVHCRAAASLGAVTIPALATSMETISMTPRYDLQLPGITIYYESTNTYNGGSFKTIATDTAGTTTDPRSVSLLVELQGFSVQTIQQAITVTAYPVAFTDKTFWRSHVPWLADIADADLTIASPTRSGQKSLGNWLAEGQIAPWMNVDTETETFTATITYTRRTSGNIDETGTKTVAIKLLSCGGTTRTYQGVLSYDAAEAQPSGLAAALYASWGRLAWDGSFTMVEAEASFQAAPGKVVNISGGLAAWSSMSAIVQDISVDIEAGITRVTTGTCGRLQADSLIALWRGVHFRRFAVSSVSRTNAGASASTVQGGSSLLRQDNSDGDPGSRARSVLRATSAEGYAQTIDLNPAGVAHASAATRTNRVIQPREILIPYQSGSNVVAKLCQVLCSDLYGTEVAIGGPAANPGGTVSTFGAGSLGVEAASAAADWVAGGANGLVLWVETRHRYYSANSRTWYAYARKLTFDNTGKLYSVSGNETRFVVEVPEV